MATKRKQSARPFTAILVVIAVAGVAVLGVLVSRPAKVITLSADLPPMAAAGVVKGSPDALVEIVEFGDFECPACGYFAALTEPDVMNRLVATGEVRFRFMDFPLEQIHRNAVAAHNAAACANEQGKFWEMHDALYANQTSWNGQAAPKPKGVLKELAGRAGVDVGAWEDCYDSERMLPQILANRREGERLRVGSTPTFLIGGQLYPGVLTYDQISDLVTAEKVRAMAAVSEKAGKAVTVDEAKAARKAP